jgi:hypothetical protein
MTREQKLIWRLRWALTEFCAEEWWDHDETVCRCSFCDVYRESNAVMGADFFTSEANGEEALKP